MEVSYLSEFHEACKTNNIQTLRKITYTNSEIHSRNDYAFTNTGTYIRHILVKHKKHNWKQVEYYDRYRKKINQIIGNLAILHQTLQQINTNILELNVIGIVKEFII
jgi:non-homologous end joining protein Ku